MSFLIKYRKLFGIIRILLGLLFLLYPFSQYLKSGQEGGQDNTKWLFALIFFILYTLSAIANGLRELQGRTPAFTLLRFFEITLNSFVALYLLIIVFTVKLDVVAVILLLLSALVIAIAALRDMRYVSLQYYEKRQRLKEKRGKK